MDLQLTTSRTQGGMSRGKKVEKIVKLQIPAGKSNTSSASRSCTRSSGYQYHGIHKRIQCTYS